ncbi:15577_t:CDS:2 [Funneliformis geosporum]|uniref:15577_t:CDS:1 n=1 Tax=Funneliformis geosporum TaxID=1117311 RepID=A0A9W4ST43_9GLOM|nr:15577_t:CDS:2 [Funneliformis geosporum]
MNNHVATLLKIWDLKAFIQENVGFSVHIPYQKPVITEIHCQIYLE